jgi:hypothetical protein
MRRSVLLLGAVLTQLLLATVAAQEPPHLKELHLIPSYCPAPCIDYELSAELENDWIFAADPSSPTLFPECLDDWIDEDNPVRVIDAFVEAIGLGELGFDGVVPEATARPIIPQVLAQALHLRLPEPGAAEPTAGAGGRTQCRGDVA